MKNLDLNNYGVQQMNAEEMTETEGGYLSLIVFGLLFAFGLLCMSHPENVEVS